MRYRRTISVLLLPTTMISLTGCIASRWVGPDDMRLEGREIEAIVTADGDSLTFDRKEWATVKRNTLVGYMDEQPYQVELNQVSAALVRYTHAPSTIVLTVFVLGAIAGIAALARSLCLSGWGGS